MSFNKMYMNTIFFQNKIFCSKIYPHFRINKIELSDEYIKPLIYH